ncbi:MAG: Uma2 family endonuclease [Lachnospiraceae bacterium]|nr:Uma2 family endonuclease [Lachnospiraceae bacterium]
MDEQVNDIYTIDYIYSLPDGKRAELIDGQIYDMAPPARTHQRLVSQLNVKIVNHINSNSGSCEVYPAPFAVFLNNDEHTYVEPDISVICDKNKLDERGCHGAPDWIIEIVSPSSIQMDYMTKLAKYNDAGVREYWIVNPIKNTVMVYIFGDEWEANQYSFDDEIQVHIYPNFSIKVGDLL